MRADGLNQSLEGVKALASLGGGAIVLWVVYEFANVILVDAADRAPGGHGGAITNDWISIGLDSVLPAVFLGLVFFGLIAVAIQERDYR